MEIRILEANDWPSVKEIYEQGIATGNATFQTEAPSWEDWNKSHLKDCRFVFESNKQIVGWAALSPVSSRCVYAGVAEVSVYVNPSLSGKGYGSILLNTLIVESEKQGLWTLQSGVFRENIGSIRMHEKAGFREVGYREKIGKMNGTWRDTILLERRNQNIK